MVLASSPVLSASRFAARPVGAASSGLAPLAFRISSIERMIVVLPTPGPLVTISTFELRASLTAAFWLSESETSRRASTQGCALSASIAPHGTLPAASRRLTEDSLLGIA